MSRVGVCERCHKNIDPDDEDAGQVLHGEMDDTWEITGTLTELADLCGACIGALRYWLAKVGPNEE